MPVQGPSLSMDVPATCFRKYVEGLSSGKAKLSSGKASYIVGFMSRKKGKDFEFPNEAKSV